LRAEAGLALTQTCIAIKFGYFTASNGTANVTSDDGDVQNFAISPSMVFVRTRMDYKSQFAAMRVLSGGGKARVVQDSLGFDYTLSKGSGYGVSAGFKMPLGQTLVLRLPVGYDVVSFQQGKLTHVETNTPPHAGPWIWRGLHFGIGVEIGFLGP
jgi:hypothetical protein